MAIYTVSKDPLKSPDFTSLATAIAGINSGDTIQIIDSETYTENFPNNITIGNITITSAVTDDCPCYFPTITFLNDIYEYQNWWTNSASSLTFEKVNLKDFKLGYLVNSSKYLTLSKCYIENNSNDQNIIEIASMNTANVLNITNCVFNGSNSNNVIFMNNNQNLTSNVLNCINNTFYNCTLIGETGTNNASMLMVFTNNVFYSTTINITTYIDTTNSKNNYIEDTNTELDSTTDIQNFIDNPFINADFLDVYDFQLSVDFNTTYQTTAPSDDISSNTRSVSYVTAGAWEYISSGTTNRFRIHVS